MTEHRDHDTTASPDAPGPKRFPAIIAAGPGAIALLFLAIGPQDGPSVPALIVLFAAAAVGVVCFSVIARFEREQLLRQIAGGAIGLVVVLLIYRLLFLYA